MLTTATRDNTIWQPDARVSGHLADWLVSDRLMTPDIRRSFDAPVRIDVLHEGSAALPLEAAELLEAPAGEGWTREIAMHCGAQLLVHALCYAPERTLHAQPWLTELGDSPLGGTLAQRDDVAREAQHYCRTALLPVASRIGSNAWSRRSLFRIGDAPLVLFEHLSAAFADVPRRTRDDDAE